MASKVIVSSSSSSSSGSWSDCESEVKLKIQMMIRLRFNTTGLDLRCLEREFWTYFHEKLDIKSLGYSSTLEFVQSMESEVEISQLDNKWIIEPVALSHERTLQVLANIFPSKPKPKSKLASGEETETRGKGGRSKVNLAQDKTCAGQNLSLGDPPSTTQKQCFAKNIQIQPADYLDLGGFGKVYRGNWDGIEVAVKILYGRTGPGPSSSDVWNSWNRRVKIYESLRRHPVHTVRFLGSEMVSGSADLTQFWIVTKYYRLGSLRKFLENNTISVFNLTKITSCIANGLSFLHLYTHDDKARPGIVHGDMRSTNILVEMDFTCVLTNFGSSIALDRTTGNLDLDRVGKPGTHRYIMAPEILEHLTDLESKPPPGGKSFTFEDYKKTDVYSVALVFWELLSRTEVEHKPVDSTSASVPEPYKLPYFEHIPELDPTAEKVRRVVCTDGLRPQIPPQCSSNDITSFIWNVVMSAWEKEPKERPCSGKVRAQIMEIIRVNKDEKSEKIHTTS